MVVLVEREKQTTVINVIAHGTRLVCGESSDADMEIVRSEALLWKS